MVPDAGTRQGEHAQRGYGPGVAELRGLLARLARAARSELAVWRAALTFPALYGLLGVLLLGLLLAVHLPLSVNIDVGIGEGYGGDLPFVQGFNTPERDEHGSYRWTADKATVTVPGLGHRPVNVALHFFPIGPEALEKGPAEINLWVDNELLAALPVRREGATYRLRVPADMLQGGALRLTIRTHTFIPAKVDDPRSLGTPLDRIVITTPADRLLVAPDWGATAMWLLAGGLFWVLVLRALWQVPRAHWWAAGFLGAAVLLVVLAAVLDPGRWAFGAQPALLATLLGYLLVVGLRPLFVLLASRFEIPLSARSLGWLLLIVAVACSLRYGGRLYPNSMHGDIGFHTNRFNEVVQGRVFLLSRNRGVDFPYPPGPYLLLAPFTLVRPDPPDLLELGAALVEGLSAALVYTIVARSLGVSRLWQQRQQPAPEQRGQPPPADLRIALLAAATYVFTAAGFMTTWWSFDTHIYAQFLTLLLVTVVHDIGLRGVQHPAVPAQTPRRAAVWLALLFVLCALVFFGHFGFFINTVLLGGLMLLLIWPASLRGAGWARALRLPVTMAGMGAALTAAALFYTYYLPLFLAQAEATAEGGLTGLADRAPVERSYLWAVMWDAGFVQHFGFFPLLLAPVGAWVLTRRGRPSLVTAALIVGSFLVSSVFAVLPFITLSTQSTRWLMFSAWAVAVGSAMVVPLLWRRGRAGRLAVVLMALFVLWNTIILWLGPMLWRIRPPEPF